MVATQQTCVELIYAGSDSEKNIYRKIFIELKKCIIESKNTFAISCHKANETYCATDRWCNKIENEISNDETQMEMRKRSVC